MHFFNNNLKFLLENKGIKPINFSSEIGITRQQLNRYLNNGMEPNYTLLVLICNKLNCSVDDILTKDFTSINVGGGQE